MPEQEPTIEEPKRLQADGDSGCTCKMPDDHHSTDCAKFDAEPPVEDEGDAHPGVAEMAQMMAEWEADQQGRIDVAYQRGVDSERMSDPAPSGEDGEGEAVPSWEIGVCSDCGNQRYVAGGCLCSEEPVPAARWVEVVPASELTRVTEERDAARDGWELFRSAFEHERDRALADLASLRSLVEEARDWARDQSVDADNATSRWAFASVDERLSRILSPGSEGS